MRRLTYQHDVELASRIYDRIAQAAPGFDRTKPYNVAFYGAHEFKTVYPHVSSSSWSGSFFQWDRGNPQRMIYFMNIVGFSNLRIMNRQTRAPFEAKLEQMPVWPAAGSVFVQDDAVLVRLGPESAR